MDDFETLGLTFQRTLKLALVLGPQELALGLKKRLQLYQAERPYRQNMKKMDHRTLPNTAASLLFATIMVFFCSEIILNLTPPISRDALIHHLAVPKLWLKHGRFFHRPHVVLFPEPADDVMIEKNC